MSPTFDSLSIRNYRVYATGGILSNTGTWMGRVAQDWVVLTELTDNSGTALGIVTGLQFL
ncbi:MAG: MFS transporter, partial [Janibacter sp.]